MHQFNSNCYWFFTENIFGYKSSVRFKINGHCKHIVKFFATSFRTNTESNSEALLFSIGYLCSQ